MADPALYRRLAPVPAPNEPRAFYEAFVSYARRTLQRLGVRAGDVDDLTQELFLRAFQRAATHQPGRPVRPWLFALAYHLALEHRRRLRRRGKPLELSEDLEPADPSDDPEVLAERRQAQERVLAALERLSLKDRAVLVLHDIDGQSVPLVAETLALSLNTAYSRLRAARRRFAAALRRGGTAAAAPATPVSPPPALAQLLRKAASR